MQTFQDTFETRKRSFISDFSICMTVPLSMYDLLVDTKRKRADSILVFCNIATCA